MHKQITRSFSILDISFLISSIIILVILSYWVMLANMDLASGRFALFMDERITFDGVKNILHPEGVKSFILSVVDGGDHRYGRSLWNSIAIFAAIPERLFGDLGQIVSARLLQYFLIVASIVVITFGILRSWLLRFVLITALLSVPFTAYYSTMPKPEPLQLFFLALFTYFFIKRNADFSWYLIFAGLAFGTKISFLPALIVILFISLIIRLKCDSWITYKKSLLVAVVFFALGLTASVPILFPPLIILVIAYYLVIWINKKLNLNGFKTLLVILPVFGWVYVDPHNFIRTWLSSTFLNSGHGADQDSINALSWLDYFFKDWLVVPEFFGLLFFFLIIGYLVLNAIQIIKSGWVIDRRMTGLIIALAGLALNLAIMLGVQRIWGFYLYTGTVLLIIGLITLIDGNAASPVNTNRTITTKSNITLGYVIAFLLLIVSIFYWLPKTLGELKDLSERTTTKDYSQNYSSYMTYTKFLRKKSIEEGRQLRVMLTPSLFPPANNEYFIINEFWGPYTKWNETPDVIVFGSVNTPSGPITPKDSPDYNAFLIERNGYAKHVVENGSECKAVPCFVKEIELVNGGEVLVHFP